MSQLDVAKTARDVSVIKGQSWQSWQQSLCTNFSLQTIMSMVAFLNFVLTPSISKLDKHVLEFDQKLEVDEPFCSCFDQASGVRTRRRGCPKCTAKIAVRKLTRTFLGTDTDMPTDLEPSVPQWHVHPLLQLAR